MSINKQYKIDLFQSAVLLDISDNSSHFLNLCITKDKKVREQIFSDISINLPEKCSGIRRSTKIMIMKSIQDIFNIFDVELYNGFSEKKGVVTLLIWKKFREYEA